MSAVNFGSIHGTVGGVALNNQSAVPPTTNSASEWWGKVASGSTLIPGADISNSVERLGGGLFKFPKLPNSTVLKYRIPHGRRFSDILLESFVSDIGIPIADISFDLSPLVEKGFSVGVVRQTEMAWCLPDWKT